MGNLALKCILPITFWIEYRLTICQLNCHFTRNNEWKSVKSLFKDDSHEAAAVLLPPAPLPPPVTAELLTPLLSSSNFHHWPVEEEEAAADEALSGLLAPARAAAPFSGAGVGWSAVDIDNDEDGIFDRKAPVDLVLGLLLLLLLVGNEGEGVFLSPTAATGERNPLRLTAADDDDAVAVLCCATKIRV